MHVPFSVKFAIKLIGYFCQHVVKYTEKLGGLRIRSSLEHTQTIQAKFQVFKDRNYF